MATLKEERERYWCQICHDPVEAQCMVHAQLGSGIYTQMWIALCRRHADDYSQARKAPHCRHCGEALTHGMVESECPSNPANK